MNEFVHHHYAIIDVYDAKNDEFVGRYMGASNAARAIGGDPSHVSAVLKGRRKTHRGFKFKYADEGIVVRIGADGIIK